MSNISLNLTEKQAMVVMTALYHWSAETSKHAVLLEDKGMNTFNKWYEDSGIASSTAAYICERLVNR